MRNNIFQQLYVAMSTVNTKRAFEDALPFPKELHVELTNTCNLRCPFCPTGQRSLKRPMGKMSEPLWWAICTEAQEYGAAIRLVRFGEPTLHIHCYDFIKRATKVGIPVHLNTNGVHLDVKQILDSGLDSIKISAHTDDVIKQVNKLVRERGDRPKPYITVSILEGEEHNLEGISADFFTKAPVKDLKEEGRTPKTCWELYNRLSIDWDGTVAACCGDYDHFMTLGYIYKNTLKEIWDGDKLKHYRELEQSGKLSECELCRRCAR